MGVADYDNFIFLWTQAERRFANLGPDEEIKTPFLLQHVRNATETLMNDEGYLKPEEEEQEVEIMDDPCADEFRDIINAARKAHIEWRARQASDDEEIEEDYRFCAGHDGNSPDGVSNPSKRATVAEITRPDSSEAVDYDLQAQIAGQSIDVDLYNDSEESGDDALPADWHDGDEAVGEVNEFGELVYFEEEEDNSVEAGYWDA